MAARMRGGPAQQFLDDSGDPLSSGTITFYTPGTTTAKDVWKDSGKAATHSNPLTLDADGRPASPIFAEGLYDVLVKDSDGTTLQSISNWGVEDTGGKNTIWIPAGAMYPSPTSGCATLANTESTANQPTYSNLAFDGSSEERAEFTMAFPKSWNEGTVTAQFFWTVAAAVTTSVRWGIKAVAVSNDGTIDVAFGTAQEITDTALNASEDLHVSSETSALTIAGTPAVDDLCYFMVYRDPTDAADDMTQDALLLGVKLFFTTDAVTDD